MKHKYSRALIVAVLTCSFSLGSVPASVGAWQLSRAIERIQMGYSGNSVSYASENDDVNVSVFDTDAAAVDDNDSDAASTVAYDQIGSKEDESLQHDLRAGGGGLPIATLSAMM